jgi:hypothetical protein
VHRAHEGLQVLDVCPGPDLWSLGDERAALLVDGLMRAAVVLGCDLLSIEHHTGTGVDRVERFYREQGFTVRAAGRFDKAAIRPLRT